MPRFPSLKSFPQMTILLPTTSTIPFDSITQASLNAAASSIKSGELVAFPTETVYGLGANALSSTAVKSIFTAKGRPSDNPLIVHIASLEMLYKLLPGGKKGVPAIYEPLIAQFWPGPLSLIFPLLGSSFTPSSLRPEEDEIKIKDVVAENAVAREVLAGASSLAIRMPSHPLALELIRLSDLPLAAPSANLSSRPSPTSAQHVLVDLGKDRGVTSILDGGECNVGVESTVVDWVANDARDGFGEVRVLRAGGVSAEQIEACLVEAGLGQARDKVKVYYKDFKEKTMEERPTTPGMKYKHYSPSNSRVVLARPSTDDSVPSLQTLIESLEASSKQGTKLRIGLMLTSETLDSCGISPIDSIDSTCDIISIKPESTTTLYSYCLGSSARPEEAAQRLFSGLRYLDSLPSSTPASNFTPSAEHVESDGVSIILLECIEENGVGLAVMERARKAAGGSDEVLFRV
jgi:L-threonylcarbamoyladenylate synthase